MTTTSHRPSTTFSAIFLWQSLKTRVTIFMLAIFLVGIWALAFYASYTLHNDMGRALGEQQFSTVSIIAAEINTGLDDRMKALEKVAALITPAMLANAATMQTFIEVRPAFLMMFNGGVFVLLHDGTAIADYPLSTGRRGLNFMDRKYASGALKGGKTTIGSPVMGKALKSTLFSIATPIHNTKGKVIGALCGTVDLAKPNFLSSITDNSYGKTGGYLLVAPIIRTIVFATEKKRIMEVLPGPGINPLIDRFIQGYEGYGITVRPSNGVEILSSAKSIPVAGWYIAAMMPTAEAFAPVHAMQKRMLLAAIFLTLLMGCLTWWMLKHQLAPVFATIKTLAALSGADQHAQPLPIIRRDEIGELIGGFNRLLGILGKREEVLKQSELRFARLAEQSRTWAWEVDQKGMFTSVSPMVEVVLGYRADELVGKMYFYDLHDKSEREAFKTAALEVFARKESFLNLDNTALTKNREMIWVSTNGFPILGENGMLQGYFGTDIDITERKQAEQALKESEERFRKLAEAGWEGLVFHKDGVLIDANESFSKMFGYFSEEVIGKSVLVFLAPESVEVAAQKLKEYSLGGQSYFEAKGLRKDKTIISIELMGRPIRYKDLDARVLAIRDITDRRRAEEALLEGEQKYRHLVELAQEGIWAIDAENKTTYVNPRMAEMLQYAVEEMQNLPLVSFMDDAGKMIFAQKMESRRQGIKEEHPFEFITKGGNRIYVTISTSPLTDDKGAYQGSIAVISDITDRKQAEEEKAKLEAQLHQAQKMDSVGRLAGGVAHDFNNMLGVIIGHAEIAMEKVDTGQPLLTDLQEIWNAAQRSADLTRQLLAFARKQVISPKVLDINETVEGMLKMLRRLIGEDIHLAWLPGVDVWPVKVDSSQIDQILANLCINARDAIAGVGKLTIETGDSSFDEDYCADHAGFIPGEFVLLAVSDDGCGMNKETIVKIFEPFFTTKGEGKGTGLGLATVYGIVKQNNGFINVYSEPGQGTTFKIYLPRHAGATEEKRMEAGAAPLKRGKETILLVEDELVLLELNKFLLERLGYQVLSAGTPGEAIRLAEEYSGEIHLLMTDVVMPEMNGQDLARKMLSQSPHLKCLFTSGYTADVIAHHGVLDEGVHFIQKPFSRRDLAAKVREALDQNTLG